jgi:diguanylate cyclase (GGDEF)-like protein/PAS domain S-box-containing protein
MQDISERRQAEEELRESEERFRRAFDDATIGMARVGLDGAWLQVNPALCQMFGYTELDLLRSNSLDIGHADDREAVETFAGELLAGRRDNYQMELRYVHRRGHTIWALAGVSVIRDRDSQPLYFIAQIQDITERKQLEEQLRDRAYHDQLTLLPNRANLMERLERALARAQAGVEAGPRGGTVGLLFLDLDGFKSVNDSLGHAAGDELLVAVAGRLKMCVRPQDGVARLGGDEFVVLLEDMSDREDATAVAQRILRSLERPFGVAGGQARVSASVGVAYPQPGLSAEALLQQADTALYAAKSAGKGRFVVYHATLRVTGDG